MNVMQNRLNRMEKFIPLSKNLKEWEGFIDIEVSIGYE